jgi:predicted nucleic acid-binding protein
VILVDTSLWIELLAKRGPRPSADDLLRFRTCGPILQEVFQGLRPGRASEAFRESFLAIPRLCDPLTWDIYAEAAEIYREGRRRGYTIRSSMDCLIAAIAIENDVTVWHRDRDFEDIARFTRLKTVSYSPKA